MTQFEIDSDGRTVWVNSAMGVCVGRFSRFGIDIHRDFTAQVAGEPECLDCTHEKPTLAEWERFKSGMMEHYGVVVGDEHRPEFLS